MSHRRVRAGFWVGAPKGAFDFARFWSPSALRSAASSISGCAASAAGEGRTRFFVDMGRANVADTWADSSASRGRAFSGFGDGKWRTVKSGCPHSIPSPSVRGPALSQCEWLA